MEHREIPLYGRTGQVGIAIVDAADLDLVQGYSWRLLRPNPKNQTKYAGTDQQGRRVLMHRLILDAPEGMEVDHINRDGLDNRRSNLRLVTTLQNAQNRPSQLNGNSRYRGVYHRRDRHTWCAQVRLNGRIAYRENFQDEESAALAAAAARQRLMTHAID